MDRGALDALIARAMRSDPANVRRFELCTPYSRPGSSFDMKHCTTTYEVNIAGFLLVLRRARLVEERTDSPPQNSDRYVLQVYAGEDQLFRHEGGEAQEIYNRCESLHAKVLAPSS